MLNKGIAIQTILLLVVGIIVVSVIVYLFYSVTTGSTLSSTQCMSRVISWCTQCKFRNWNVAGGCTINGADLTKCECLGPGTKIWDEWASACTKGSSSTDPWNFDPDGSPNKYDTVDPKKYCARVGIN